MTSIFICLFISAFLDNQHQVLQTHVCRPPWKCGKITKWRGEETETTRRFVMRIPWSKRVNLCVVSWETHGGGGVAAFQRLFIAARLLSSLAVVSLAPRVHLASHMGKQLRAAFHHGNRLIVYRVYSLRFFATRPTPPLPSPPTGDASFFEVTISLSAMRFAFCVRDAKREPKLCKNGITEIKRGGKKEKRERKEGILLLRWTLLPYGLHKVWKIRKREKKERKKVEEYSGD